MKMNKNKMMQTEMPLNASRGICFRAGRGIQRHTPFRGCLYLPPHVPLGACGTAARLDRARFSFARTRAFLKTNSLEPGGMV